MNNLALETFKPAKAAGDNPRGEGSSYARELRALGQALEARQVMALDLVAVADVYAIRAKARAAKDLYGSDSAGLRPALAKLWSAIIGKHERKTEIQTIELRYNLEDIMQLDRLGRSKRINPQGTPNPNALSQILRSAGSYLDLKEHSSLIGISVQERRVTIRYQSPDGQAQEMMQDTEFFYDIWVKMYLRRSNRPSLSTSEDRTLSGIWKQINEVYDSTRRRR
jgi:hypothetical protein